MPAEKQNPLMYLILVPVVIGSASPWWWEKLEGMVAGNSEPTSYRVRVKTASHKNAGTDAGKFYITLLGDDGISPVFLMDHAKTDDRRVGAEDTYTFDVDSSLGEIRELEIRSTGETKGEDGWLLERAIVEDLSGEGKWTFTCNKWIQSDGGGNLEIIMKTGGKCE